VAVPAVSVVAVPAVSVVAQRVDLWKTTYFIY
jgi:hypothetical protein